MAFDVNNPYFRNEVLTASPQKLRLLLLDGCIAFMNDGRQALLDADHENVYDNFSKARDILVELISGMDRSQSPDICDKMAALYTFVFQHLTVAGFEKSTDKADECIRIMNFERDTWAMLMEKQQAERKAPPASGQPADAQHPQRQAPSHAASPAGYRTGNAPPGGLSISA